MASTGEAGQGRRPELDGIRGIAILMVLVGHGLVPFGLGPLAAVGVTLFYTLSGFLITGLLVAEYQKHGRIRLQRFYARRFTRLAPPLLLMVGVICIAAGGLPASSWLPAITYTANYAGIGERVVPVFGHTWSLAVEEHFYLLWPIALGALLARRRPVVVLGAVLAVLLTWRTWLLFEGHLSWAYSSSETAGSAIIAGCLVSLAGWRLSSRHGVLAIGGLFAVAAIGGLVRGDAWLWLPLFATPFAAAALAAAPSCPWLRTRPLAFCGVASYSMYLWHESVSAVLAGEAAGLTPHGVALGALCGLVAYFAFEAPLMRWRARRAAAEQASPRDRVFAA